MRPDVQQPVPSTMPTSTVKMLASGGKLQPRLVARAGSSGLEMG